MKRPDTHFKTAPQGFTLVETVITIGVIAVMLTAFLAFFGLANDSLRDSINSREADRLRAALERELSILREDEATSGTGSAFEKAYGWIDKSSRGEGKIFIYNYQGNLGSVAVDDGFPEPDPDGGAEGAGTAMTPVARFVENGSFPDGMKLELDAVSGPVFFVQTTQLIYKDGEIVLGEPGIIPPHEGQAPLPSRGGGADSYPEGTLAFRADFYLLPTNSPEYIESLSTENLRRPLFSRHMGVNR